MDLGSEAAGGKKGARVGAVVERETNCGAEESSAGEGTVFGSGTAGRSGDSTGSVAAVIGDGPLVVVDRGAGDSAAGSVVWATGDSGKGAGVSLVGKGMEAGISGCCEAIGS